MRRIRVLLADDHAIVRLGIRKILERSPDITVVGEASDGTSAIRLVAELVPDVLLLDIEMPDMKGYAVARQLAANGSPVRILALSAYHDRQYILGMLKSGAAGYLTKDELPEKILEAVRGVYAGQVGWVSQRVRDTLRAWNSSGAGEAISLTGLEAQVLALIVAGKSDQDIGRALRMDPTTVGDHVRALFAKLGVESRIEAAVLAVREGLV